MKRRKRLKKNQLQPWTRLLGDSSKKNAEFVCQMESVLQVYQRHHHPDFPVILMKLQTTRQKLLSQLP